MSGRRVALGERVRARYRATTLGPGVTRWYAGHVAAVHADGTVDVRYDDGDFEAAVKREFVRPLAAQPGRWGAAGAGAAAEEEPSRGRAP